MLSTDTVTVRRFTPDDWRDLLAIARTNAASPFAACDVPWPTDEAAIRATCAYIATDPNMWAIEARALGRVVAFVNFNRVTDEGYLDIGHLTDLDVADLSHTRDGLRLLCDMALADPKLRGICAYWAADDAVKLAPLLALGMRVVATSEGPYLDGSPGSFIGAELRATREEYQAALQI